MDVLDSKYVDVKIEKGVVKIELPLIEVIKEIAKKSDNKIDDKLVELLEKALG